MSLEKSIFAVLAAASARNRFRFLVIGGYSLEAYGYRRYTEDRDVMVTAEDVPTVENVLIGMGYERAYANNSFLKFKHRLMQLEDVDVMFVTSETFDKLWSRRHAYCRGTATLHVPAALHIAALKLHAIKNNPDRRGKDLNDIRELIARNPDEFPVDELRTVCERYGPPGIFNDLNDYLRS